MVDYCAFQWDSSSTTLPGHIPISLFQDGKYAEILIVIHFGGGSFHEVAEECELSRVKVPQEQREVHVKVGEPRIDQPTRKVLPVR